MILYTSGTTGKPKGVVTTHDNIAAQITSLVRGLGLDGDDRILEVLPLHHVHGIVNVISCALWVGAVCEILPRFDAAEVWERIAAGDLTLFMAVPTIYVKLIDCLGEGLSADADGCPRAAASCASWCRVPRPCRSRTLERWQEISGHVLLERYGMTEIGMAISNSLDGQSVSRLCRPAAAGGGGAADRDRGAGRRRNPGRDRNPGPGGFPGVLGQAGGNPKVLPGRLVLNRRRGGAGKRHLPHSGPQQRGHHQDRRLQGLRPGDRGGPPDPPGYQRSRSGGSADPVWGERVVAALVLRQGASLEIKALRAWGKERLATYKVPQEAIILQELPRNAMGKVSKPDLKKIIQAGKE